MAKRRKSKKSKKLGLILSLLIVLCGVLAIALFLSLDAVKLYLGDKAFNDQTFTGLRAAFGYTESAGSLQLVLVKPSYGLIGALALVVVGVLLALPRKGVLNLVGGILLLVAAGLFISSGMLTVLTDEIKKLYDFANSKVNLAYKPEIGAYLATGFAGLSGLIALVKAVLRK